MEPNVEIRRLLDVMPASGRMTTKILSKPEQPKVIDASFPQPWNQARPIYINFDLWRRLTKPQRDLLLLQMVSWLTGVKWFKPDIYQGAVLAGLLGGFLEAAQSDVVGVAVAGGLSAIAAFRIWRTNKSQESELNADAAAIKIAQRRGYSEAEAAQHLLSAIEAVAKIEGRASFNFRELQEINYPILWGGQHERHIDWALVSPTPQELIGYFFIWKSLTELIRCQNLRAIAGLSPVGIPESYDK